MCRAETWGPFSLLASIQSPGSYSGLICSRRPSDKLGFHARTDGNSSRKRKIAQGCLSLPPSLYERTEGETEPRRTKIGSGLPQTGSGPTASISHSRQNHVATVRFHSPRGESFAEASEQKWQINNGAAAAPPFRRAFRRRARRLGGSWPAAERKIATCLPSFLPSFLTCARLYTSECRKGNMPANFKTRASERGLLPLLRSNL